jgi:hypothetical protein
MGNDNWERGYAQNMSAMKMMVKEQHKNPSWTKQKPTVDGWYWAYEDYGDSYAIDFIRVEFRAHEPTLILSVEHERVDNFDNWQTYLGPVEPPELPEEFLRD